MKKYLLFIISMVCAVTGAWAENSGNFGTNSTWEVKPGSTMVITLGDGDRLQTLIDTWTENNTTTLPTEVQNAKVVKLVGNLTNEDYSALGSFTDISSFDFSDATLASGFWGGISNNSTTVVLPKSVTDARSYYTNTITQEAPSNNPYQIKHIFAYKDATEITCYLTTGLTGNNELFRGTNDKTNISDANYTNFINGVETLNIEHITKGQRVTLDPALVSSINGAWQSIETINCVNATAPDYSNFTIANVHAKTINLSGLNAKNGVITLADAGDAQSLVTEFVLTGAKVQKISVVNQDQLEVLNITDIVLEDGGVVDVTGAGKNGELVIHVSDNTVNITPKSGESGTSYTISDPLRNAYTYSDFIEIVNNSTYNMALHKPDETDKLCYWYVSDQTATDAVVTIDLNSRIGELSNILTEIGNKHFEKVIINGPVSADDVEAFKDIDATVLDLSGATLKRKDGDTYVADNSIIKSATNAYVKFLVLPDGSTRDDVKDEGGNVTSYGIVNEEALKGFTGLYAAVEEHIADSKRSITTYTKKEGTLQPAMVVAGGMAANGWTRGTRNAYYPSVNQGANLIYATLSGEMNAYDICNAGQKINDATGHFEWDMPASETVYDLVDPRKLVGTEVYGGLSNAGVIKELDLEKAVFLCNTDMTLSDQGAKIVGTDTWKVVIPTDPRVIETPAWFTTSNAIKEICIPSNIQIIRTHFAQSVDHIWTTAYATDAKGTKYDNGAFETLDEEDNPQPKNFGYTKFTFSGLKPYGTYTLSSNVKLIESCAFYNTTPHVKDVYVLAKEAPECHVDAFNTAMYVASGGYNPTITDGVITRDSYVNGSSWITMLHYPRECVTPNVQRYTDPTRKYTTASNERDGKGGVLYYPNFSEFLAAYAQGTTGYVWNAWSQEYEYGSLKESLTIGGEHWSADIQKQGNDTYLKNPKRSENPYTSFYDVTANGLYSQPTGLEPYSNIYWNEKILYTNGSDEDDHLYPAAETSAVYYNYIDAQIATSDDFSNFNGTLYTKDGTEYVIASTYSDGTTYYKREQIQKTDSNGNKVYEACPGGDYVAEDSYVKAANGDYVRKADAIEGSYTAVTKEQEYVDTYYTDNAGTKEEATPKVKNDTYWYENGTDPQYSEAIYNPVNGVDTYYTKSNENVYTPTTATLNATYYYKTGETDNTYSSEVYSPVENIDEYYEKNSGVYTKVTPQLTTNSGDLYYLTGETTTTRKKTYNFIPGVYNYYSTAESTEAIKPTLNQYGAPYYAYKNSNNIFVSTTTVVEGVDKYYWAYNANDFSEENSSTNIGISESYYDQEGPEYKKTTQFVTGKYTYYTYNQNNDTYTELTNGCFSKAYYYATGTTDKYASTTEWNPTRTYYTDNYNGTYSEYSGPFTFSTAYYYVNGSTVHYDSANGQDWNAHDYFTDANGANPAETIEFDGTYYIQDYDYTYTAYNADTDAGKERWAKNTVYVAAETPGTGSFCPIMEDKKYRDVTKSHDYRGWHQFVLNAYAANTNDPVQPVRSYITDTDWWTICLPYDLTYNEMMLLYGDIQGGEVPQLCLLSNVVRDESRRHITLNFSSNLMQHKATKNANGVWEVSTTEAPNHDVDEDTNHGGSADVVLHAGVPYLIKPTFTSNNRQFDIYGGNNVNEELSAGRITAKEEDYPGLFKKIAFSTTVDGKEFRELQEKNIYTVPALLPAGENFEYSGTEKALEGDENHITIGTKNYVRSADFDYTFVGSLAKAIIPPYSYFLGYTNKACFIYADYTTEKFAQNKKANTPDYANVMLWNNNSCVICPNMLKSNDNLETKQHYNLGKGSHDGKISLATNKQAAQWKIYGESVTATLSDDLYHSSSVSSAVTSAPMAMMFGMDMLYNNDETTSIKVDGVEIMPTTTRVYSLNGQYVGESLEGLAKGIYIVNGKKVMVK